MTTRRNQSGLRGRGPLTPREKASTASQLNLEPSRSPKACVKNMVTDGDNLIKAGTYDIELGVTLTVSDGDELVVI